MCSDRPLFYRGKYKKYAKGHDKVSFQHQYMANNNIKPKCINCGSILPLNKKRTHIKQFCSFVCSGTYNKDVIISKMKPKIIELYKNSDYRRRIGEASKRAFSNVEYYNKWKIAHRIGCQSDAARINYSNASKKIWLCDEFKQLNSIAIKRGVNTPHELNRRREYQLAAWQDPIKKIALYRNLFNIARRFSKLHVKIRNYLELDKFGFLGEVGIGGYIADEINHEKKIIIEVNGDYVHANPKLYTADDLIRLPGASYTASDKWKSDEKKLKYLYQLGYHIIVIWESDDLEYIKRYLHSL